MAKDTYYVETLANGKQRLVLKRHNSHSGASSSSRHHHHGHHGGEECARITRDELTILQERERGLRETNEGLARENHALKSNWHACDVELRRLQQVVVPNLEIRLRQVEHENHELRRSLDATTAGDEERNTEMEARLRQLRHRNTRLENERETLAQRLRSLERSIEERVREGIRNVRAELDGWRRRAETAEARAQDLQAEKRLLAGQNGDYVAENRELRQTIASYERILRRHGFL